MKKISPLADIVECTSQDYDELGQDFKNKYAGVQAIYHYRDPGGPFGYLGEDFLRRIPPSCKVISHRERLMLVVGLGLKMQWALDMTTLMS